MGKFKPYDQNQLMLLPPSLDDLIPGGHLVRFVDDVVNRMELDEIYDSFKGGGAPAYSPGMMLKVWLYGYVAGACTCRKLAAAIRENVNFMWLAGMQRPDFRTLNRFRTGVLKDKLNDVFRRVVMEAAAVGLVKFENFFVDGTKVEANANRHKIVWRKNTERYKASVQDKIAKFLEEIERLQEKEDWLCGAGDLPEVGEGLNYDDPAMASRIKKGARKISKALKKKKKKAERELKKLQARKAGYEAQERTLCGRNSYSKTDPDASATRMKDDQLKPGYNLMIGCENQVVVSYEVRHNSNDGVCFPGLMEKTKKLYGRHPDNVCGDSAFGTEENYEYCKENGITAYLKYHTYHAEKKQPTQKTRFKKEHFTYEADNDVYTCPEGKTLEYSRESQRETRTGYVQNARIYVCSDCSGCPCKPLCTRGVNRTIYRIEKLENHKCLARELLDSEVGVKQRKMRGVEAETPFGDLKHNRHCRRFQLRGSDKVNLEAGFRLMAYNFRKIFGKVTSDVEKGVKNLAELMKSSKLYALVSG